MMAASSSLESVRNGENVDGASDISSYVQSWLANVVGSSRVDGDGTDARKVMCPEDLAPEREWDEAGMTSMIENLQDYDVVLDELRLHLDTTSLRTPAAVTWMRDHARVGHVPLAVHSVRNLVKSRVGPVPGVDDVRFCFEMFLFTLLRTIQDTAAIRKLGTRIDGGVYAMLRDKCFLWILEGVHPSHWPSVEETVAALRPTVLTQDHVESMPTPFWVTRCRRSATALVGGSHIHFMTPHQESVESWYGRDPDTGHRIISGVGAEGNATRLRVGRQFLDKCLHIGRWSSIVKMDAKDLVALRAFTGREEDDSRTAS